MHLNPHAINIFTDGSAIPNPGKSGHGIVIIFQDSTISEIQPVGYKVSTNNRSELRACVDALRALQKDPRAVSTNYVCIHSDSEYVVSNYMMALSGKWQDRGWKTVTDNDVDNKSLWQDFSREVRKSRKRVEVFKVKAHKGIKFNEMADRLADKSRKSAQKDDFHSKRTQVGRWLPITDKKVHNDHLPKFVTVYVQRTDRRTSNFEAHVQILRPKKYFGGRVILRGAVDVIALKARHIHKVHIEKESSGLRIKQTLKDFGSPKDNPAFVK